MEMLKGGIFLDVENINRNGGWGMRCETLLNLVIAQKAFVLRANAYMAFDEQREKKDIEYRMRKEKYRDALRRAGMHLVFKRVQRFSDEHGETVLKADADLDIAIDALLQAENLDYILLCTGDGDFLRLVRALQSRGKRVDVLSFTNTSTALKHEADYYFSGYLIPDLLPDIFPENSLRALGVMHEVKEDKGYGFLTVRTGLRSMKVRNDVFCHINDFTVNGDSVSNEYFAKLKTREVIIEFDLTKEDNGKMQAVNATEFQRSPGE